MSCKSADTARDEVKNYYGKVLKSSKDLKTNACSASGRPHPVVEDALSKVPFPVLERFFGCGTPIPLNIEGLSVLDLGAGSGRDCYIAAVLAGPKGKVTGVDMLEELLSIGRDNVDEFTKEMGFPAPTITFKQGYIEDLAAAGIETESVDLVISNCVVNLTTDKRAVISEAYRVLRNGGEFYFSDLYVDRRIPQELRDDIALRGEFSGATYEPDFIEMARGIGFDVREVKRAPLVINHPALKSRAGNANFTSVTYRLFKLQGLESRAEDYGQVAIYKGGIVGHETKYALDSTFTFEQGRPVLVDGNTALVLSSSTLHRGHFTVVGDDKTHYGLFQPPRAACAEPPAPVVKPSKGACK